MNVRQLKGLNFVSVRFPVLYTFKNGIRWLLEESLMAEFYSRKRLNVEDLLNIWDIII